MNYAYAESTLKSQVSISAWDAIAHASPIVQLTLLILILMSVISWAIAVSKHKQMNITTSDDEKFETMFWKANSLDDIYNSLDDFKNSTKSKVFKLAYLELRKLADLEDNENNISSLKGIDNLERALRKAIDSELAKLEGRSRGKWRLCLS